MISCVTVINGMATTRMLHTQTAPHTSLSPICARAARIHACAVHWQGGTILIEFLSCRSIDSRTCQEPCVGWMAARNKYSAKWDGPCVSPRGMAKAWHTRTSARTGNK